jgi:hypothetical protein
MEAIAHNKAFAKKAGVPQSVGKDFSNADKGKTFKKGGEMRPKKQAMKPRVDPMVLAAMMRGGAGGPPPGAAPAPMPMAQGPSGPPPGGMGMKKGGMAKEHHRHLAEHHLSMAEHHHAMHSKGGKVKKMAKGGIAEDPAIERGERHLKHGEHAVQERGHTKAREFKMPGGSTTGMKRGGMPRFAEGGRVSASNRADGIAKKGFTRGKYC